MDDKTYDELVLQRTVETYSRSIEEVRIAILNRAMLDAALNITKDFHDRAPVRSIMRPLSNMSIILGIRAYRSAMRMRDELNDGTEAPEELVGGFEEP
jgi:hypothetical protein